MGRCEGDASGTFSVLHCCVFGGAGGGEGGDAKGNCLIPAEPPKTTKLTESDSWKTHATLELGHIFPSRGFRQGNWQS